MSDIPFVEKYRPSSLHTIVFNDINKIIIDNIIEKNIYPNLLLYGPPGTGKTTTVINLINHIQKNDGNKSLLLHLNASDERGIDTIRNQIAKFINSKPLFSNRTKFIVLDEVDYMTKNAQLALRYLLQQYHNKAVFCLMCNYISKIDESLKNEFIELKFNNLPTNDIINFIKEIINAEEIKMSEGEIIELQHLFKNDMRSMINYIQMNYNNKTLTTTNILSDAVILELYDKIKTCDDKESILTEYCLRYNTTPKNICINMFVLIQKYKQIEDSSLIERFELAIHEDQYNIYELKHIINLFSLIE